MSSIVEAADATKRGDASNILPYPEGTPYAENKAGTYWPNLNPNAQKAFDFITEWVGKEKVDLNDLSLSALDHKLTILRYLRANNFDTKKTTAHMMKNIEWRKNMNVNEIIKKRPEDILGYGMQELTTVFPHWQYGFDKTGRPVVYKQYGKFDAAKVKKMSGGSYDKVIEYHVWEHEACSRLCKKQSLKLGRTIETTTGIVDVKDMKLFQITRDFLSLTRSIADVDQGQYPETLGRIYILNAPSLFWYVYSVVRAWLDPVVAAKIFVLAGPDEYIPVLIDFIGKENLPSNYGGDLPPLSPEVHPYALTLAEEYDASPTESLPVTDSSAKEESAADAAVAGEEDGVEENLKQIEQMASEIAFRDGDNTNHTADGKLLTPTSSEKV